MNDNGLIFNIQRFSLHDGPGIRTTVFFKGCPLSCLWCQNPEGISSDPDLFRHESRCIVCRACLRACPEKAISFNEEGLTVDRDKCSLCRACVDACPSGALEAAGREVTAAGLTEEILKDRVIFEESGGGVTVSGGEPLLQPAFLAAFLKSLKELDINTAVETCGYAPWPILEKVSAWTDLFLYDLKLISSDKSLEYTGADSRPALENLRKLAGTGCPLRIRMPLIPTVNDDPESLRQAAAFLKECGISELELIPYHNLGSAKYAGLGLTYTLHHLVKPSTGQLAAVQKALKKYGIATISEG